MVRKDLASQVEALVAAFSNELLRAFNRAIHSLSNDEFSQRKRDLLIEAFSKGDLSAPVVQEWVRLAERYYPNLPWRRFLHLDGSEEDE